MQEGKGKRHYCCCTLWYNLMYTIICTLPSSGKYLHGSELWSYTYIHVPALLRPFIFEIIYLPRRIIAVLHIDV